MSHSYPERVRGGRGGRGVSVEGFEKGGRGERNKLPNDARCRLWMLCPNLRATARTTHPHAAIGTADY